MSIVPICGKVSKANSESSSKSAYYPSCETNAFVGYAFTNKIPDELKKKNIIESAIM